MRFTLGFALGVIVGKPLLNAVSEYLTPPVRRKLAGGVNALAEYLNDRIENHNRGDES